MRIVPPTSTSYTLPTCWVWKFPGYNTKWKMICYDIFQTFLNLKDTRTPLQIFLTSNIQTPDNARHLHLSLLSGLIATQYCRTHLETSFAPLLRYQPGVQRLWLVSQNYLIRTHEKCHSICLISLNNLRGNGTPIPSIISSGYTDNIIHLCYWVWWSTAAASTQAYRGNTYSSGSASHNDRNIILRLILPQMACRSISPR